MAEFTTIAVQTVAAGQNVVFTETPVRCCRGNIQHREGSGVFRLRSPQNGVARYRVTFGGNIAIPTGSAVGPISIALSVDGEPLVSATATVTPAAVNEFNNVFTAVFVEAACGCCATVAVENTSTIPILVNNANIIIERVC